MHLGLAGSEPGMGGKAMKQLRVWFTTEGTRKVGVDSVVIEINALTAVPSGYVLHLFEGDAQKVYPLAQGDIKYYEYLNSSWLS